MIGYHHVLMMVIAVAIILLCKFALNTPRVIGMWANHLQRSCWLDARRHPRKSPASF